MFSKDKLYWLWGIMKVLLIWQMTIGLWLKVIAVYGCEWMILQFQRNSTIFKATTEYFIINLPQIQNHDALKKMQPLLSYLKVFDYNLFWGTYVERLSCFQNKVFKMAGVYTLSKISNLLYIRGKNSAVDFCYVKRASTIDHEFCLQYFSIK